MGRSLRTSMAGVCWCEQVERVCVQERESESESEREEEYMFVNDAQMRLINEEEWSKKKREDRLNAPTHH